MLTLIAHNVLIVTVPGRSARAHENLCRTFLNAIPPYGLGRALSPSSVSFNV
jgi:hypothetical protein